MTKSGNRGRQRCEESEEAILSATLHLLKEKPLRDITIEEIARKAGVGKATIYKWWPSKAYVAPRCVLEKNESNGAHPGHWICRERFQGTASRSDFFFHEPDWTYL